MPIYEFACPKCRMIFNFFSKKVNPGRPPSCPKCGNKKMSKQVSNFSMIKGAKEPSAAETDLSPAGAPDMEDPKLMRAMAELERDMEHLDESNPKHMAHVMKKMKDVLPPGSMPKELDIAIRRLEKGEDPEKIEQDMGDVLGSALGGMDAEGEGDGMSGFAGPAYRRDSTLYDY